MDLTLTLPLPLTVRDAMLRMGLCRLRGGLLLLPAGSEPGSFSEDVAKGGRPWRDLACSCNKSETKDWTQ
jgi:hypothetical protein